MGLHSSLVSSPFFFISVSLFIPQNTAADSGSIYNPHPLLSYAWDPDQPIPSHHRRTTTSFSEAYPPPRPSYNGVNLPQQSPPFNDNPNYPVPDNTNNSGYHNGFQGGYSPTSTTRPNGLAALHSATSYELGPHPADPHSTVLPTPASPTVSSLSVPGYPFSAGASASPGSFQSNNSNTCSERVLGKELFVYGGQGGFVLVLPSSTLFHS